MKANVLRRPHAVGRGTNVRQNIIELFVQWPPLTRSLNEQFNNVLSDVCATSYRMRTPKNGSPSCHAEPTITNKQITQQWSYPEPQLLQPLVRLQRENEIRVD